MPTTLRDCNIRAPADGIPALDSVSMPRELRKGSSDPHEVIQHRTLPRIIGVEHSDYFFEFIADEIRLLPAGSTVGFEVGGAAPESPILQQFPDLDIFASLARIAEKEGHEVFWLERNLTRFDGPQRHWIREAERTLSEMLEKGFRSNSSFSYAELERRIAVAKPHENEKNDYFWRSKMQCRSILKKADWKETDAVIVGLAHAADLSDILSRDIDTVIGEFSSREHASNVVRNLVAETRALHREMEKTGRRRKDSSS